MGKKTPDALVSLLVDKYGIAPDEADAYAAQIIAGKAGSGNILKEEALKNVADTEVSRMNQIKAAGDYVSSPIDNSHLSGMYDRLANQSKEMTRDQAEQAYLQRQQEQASLTGTANSELGRIANMLSFTGDVRPLPNDPGGYTSGYAAPGVSGFATPLQPAATPTGRRTEGTPPEVIQVNPNNPYAERIRRAKAFRDAVLGGNLLGSN